MRGIKEGCSPSFLYLPLPLWGRVHPEGFSLKGTQGMRPTLPNRCKILFESPFFVSGERVVL